MLSTEQIVYTVIIDVLTCTITLMVGFAIGVNVCRRKDEIQNGKLKQRIKLLESAVFIMCTLLEASSRDTQDPETCETPVGNPDAPSPVAPVA